MTVQTRVAIATILLALVAGCREQPTAPVREVVLRPGESVTATNKYGTVRISYVAATKRRFEWDQGAQTVTMTPRPERFMGKLGLYEPGSGGGGVRLVAQEATRDFEDYDQLYAALRESSAVLDWVYTRDGLVVGFGRTPHRGGQVNVDLYQFLVQGRKPTGLKGSREERIRRTPDAT